MADTDRPGTSSTRGKRGRGNRPPPRTLSVLRKVYVTPNMLRVTLGGSELEGFPADAPGGYVKLQLGKQADSDKPLVRTYTVRHFDAEACELDIDFVVHENEGPAANWALSCAAGDQLKVGGPGPRKSLDSEADWFFVVGDMSALPAISVNLERLHADAVGYAVIELIHADDQQDIKIPSGVKVNWVINSEPETPNQILPDAVKALPWLPGRASVWVAGELNASLTIREYFKTNHAVTRDQMYASSYWQIGSTEDGHRQSKQRITA